MESLSSGSDAGALVSPASVAPEPGPTLLPASVAKAVSLATRSTGIAIRLGSFFGCYGLDAARLTTLSSLELARGMVEGILVRACRDTALRQRSDLATSDAETLLERSLEGLHHAATQAVFWTSASFQFTGTTFLAASELSQLFLSSFDQLFGSTDSSRAIASIVTLIRREFNNPATGTPGEQVGVIDLVIALSTLAYLQRRCGRVLDHAHRAASHEQIIWDVVVVDDGTRVDVQGNALDTVPEYPENDYALGQDGKGSMPLRQRPLDTMQNDEQVVDHLKSQIASSLSPGTSVNIASSVSTTHTITVDVHGPQALSLPTPPGAEIIEAKKNSANSPDSDDTSYRIVYKIHKDKQRNTSLHRHEESPSVVELDDKDIEPQKLALSPQTTHDSTSSSDISLGPTSPSSGSFRLEEPTPGATKKTTGGSGSTPPPPKTQVQRSAPGSANVPKRTSSRPSPSTGPSSVADNAANQKRTRAPLHKSTSRGNMGKARQDTGDGRKTLTKRRSDLFEAKPLEKKGSLKQVLKGSGQSISHMWNRDPATASSARASTRPRPQWRTVGGTPDPPPTVRPNPPVGRTQKPPERRPGSRSSLRLDPESIPRTPSRASYVSVHERRRDSVVSQADSFSVRSGELRPASPSITRTELTAHETLVRQPNDASGPMTPTPSYRGFHRRNVSAVPSMYSLGTNDSQTSLLLSSYYQKSAYNTSDSLETLRRAGAVEGTFPSAHLLRNISRYMRFSSASYGSQFLKLMGISNNMPTVRSGDETHDDVRHFVHHTESESGNILLASFVDPGGGSDATGATGSGMPLVHYISLDHESKAVVLACRGTLGFEDVLADLTCDYDSLTWRGRVYRVHKGIHASARRILYGGDGRVLITLQEALREFPDYGLVLCGHSLGGAVTSLLGVMLAEPNPTGTGFVTAPQLQGWRAPGGDETSKVSGLRLPPGRPIHVFAYGPPGAMSTTLCKITKGLITTVIHGSDLVPSLSLGLLHDFQAVALAFKKDEHQAKAELRQRMWQAFQSNIRGPAAAGEPSADDERWMVATLESLRASMKNEKLMPPGEVFCIESHAVLRRDAFVRTDEVRIGRPAQRIVLRYVKDVQARFREVRFGTSMLTDHSPAQYERALNKLRLGVAE